ncbi:unnamed protein product [Taenia asiatica]|uniref:Uncharacterized protein n=1 Tax=Taenia asiatica TaxID=60517 RepID=A0A0R3VZP4_TAEAS|nr:unnamed protein product [Taenia asiatica]
MTAKRPYLLVRLPPFTDPLPLYVQVQNWTAFPKNVPHFDLLASLPTERCTCSPNAAYNTTNPRLPPYPEPCELQPEARLRPRMPSHSTASGYTAAAINAATASSAALAGLVHLPLTTFAIASWLCGGSGLTSPSNRATQRCLVYPANALPVERLS